MYLHNSLSLVLWGWFNNLVELFNEVAFTFNGTIAYIICIRPLFVYLSTFYVFFFNLAILDMIVHILWLFTRFIEKANFIYRHNSGFSSQYYRYQRDPITKKVSFVIINLWNIRFVWRCLWKILFFMGWGSIKTGRILRS